MATYFTILTIFIVSGFLLATYVIYEDRKIKKIVKP